MSDKINLFVTVYTRDNREFESIVQEATKEDSKELGEFLQDMKNMAHLSITVIDALGRECRMFFNPEAITAVRITEWKP